MSLKVDRHFTPFGFWGLITHWDLSIVFLIAICSGRVATAIGKDLLCYDEGIFIVFLSGKEVSFIACHLLTAVSASLANNKRVLARWVYFDYVGNKKTHFRCNLWHVLSFHPTASLNTTHNTTGPIESCLQSPIKQNVTLRGGINAGSFKKLAQYVAMQLCIRLCCEEKGCDVALMSGKNCYGVQCFSEELCTAVPARKAPSSLMISHVTITGEGMKHF